MSRACQISSKKPLRGNKVSHSNRKTKTRSLPNLQTRKFWLASEKRWIRLRLAANAIRTIDKRGIEQVVRELRAEGHSI